MIAVRVAPPHAPRGIGDPNTDHDRQTDISSSQSHGNLGEGATMRLGPHLHRIGNDIVAAYLVDTDEGVTVVDAGLAGHWRDLIAELASMGRSLDDIRGVVLTHGDTDHIGFAERLRRDHGVPVYVHEADAARARGEVKTKASWGRSGSVRRPASCGTRSARAGSVPPTSPRS